MKHNPSDPVAMAIACFDRQYRERGLGAQRRYPNESLIQFIASRFFRLPESDRARVKVLELGCGSGANLWMLAKEGFEVHGIDSSAAALELARDHLHGKWGVGAQLKEGDFAALPYAAETFDAVVDVVSLQHLGMDSATAALTETARVLKATGEFFSYRLSDHSSMFAAPAARRMDAATLWNIDDPSMPLANNGPIAFWSPALARQNYERAGLSVVSCERVGRTYESGAYVEYLAITAAKAAAR